MYGGAPEPITIGGRTPLIISETPEHTENGGTLICGGLVTTNVCVLVAVPHWLVILTEIVCGPAPKVMGIWSTGSFGKTAVQGPLSICHS